MKNKIKIAVPVFILGLSFILFSFTKDSKQHYVAITSIELIDIPAEIQSILDNKCMGCHSDEAKGGKSKMKMNFNKFTDGRYSTGKTISKLGKITKQLNKNKMPPQKLLDKYPEKKLTEDETKILLNWATEQKNALAGE